MPRRSKDSAANAAEKAIEEHVAGRVRLRLGLLGMTQSDLAKALAITFQQVQKYERGSNRISVGKLYRLADVLDVPMTYFFDGLEGEAARPPAETNDVSGILSRRELDLIRAWRSADPEVADAVSGLLRAVVPDQMPKPSAPATGMPVPAETEGNDAPSERVAKAPRRRGRPPGAGRPGQQRPVEKFVAAAPTGEGKQRRQRGAIWDPADIREYKEEE